MSCKRAAFSIARCRRSRQCRRGHLSAAADAYEGAVFTVTDPVAALAAAEAKMTKALSSAPDHARGHMALGLVDMWTKRAAEGIAECEHALELDQNIASAHAIIGMAKVYVGRAEETETHIVEALRLSPRDTNAYIWMHIAGTAKLYLGALRAGDRVVSAGDRGQPKLSYSIFPVGGRARPTRSTGRGAFRGEGRPRAQPGLHHLPRPRRLDGVQRRPDIPGPA